MMYHRTIRQSVFTLFLMLLSPLSACAASQAGALAHLTGADFRGGACERFGSVQHGKHSVNYIYAQPNGDESTLKTAFSLDELPEVPVFLHLQALDDDGPDQCSIRITLNDTVIFQGRNEFAFPRWHTRQYPIPRGSFKTGENQLVIANTEPNGSIGNPPWFMVSLAAIAPEDFELRSPPRDLSRDFVLHIPEQRQPIPEPLSNGHDEPGFKIRGSKGWLWTPEQYLQEIPYLKQFKMNFLMNCYGSMFSQQSPRWVNEWWKPMSEQKKQGFAEVIRQCQANDIIYCFAFHPQFVSPRPLDPTSEDDINTFFQHFAWAQTQGVHWFSVSWDDVTWGDQGAGIGGQQHSKAINTIFNRLREKDPDAQLIFCPVPYWGDGTDPEHRAYLEAVAEHMHPDVYIFWTGDAVVTPRITRQAAQSYRDIVGHRLVLWDNYPVNDDGPTIHIGPVTGRDPDLCEVIDGYISNPLSKQNAINRIPLATCADYAYNPWDYDPERSIGQAILSFADTPAQQSLLKDLVEMYPGMLIFGGGTHTNPLRERYNRIAKLDHPACSLKAFMDYAASLSRRFDEAFPNEFGPAKNILINDLDWMRQQYHNRYFQN